MTPLILAAALALAPAAPARGPEPPCTTRLKAAEDARDLYKVKLAEETERADAQAYLIRLELGITKQRLTAALAKCGPACAAPAPTPR